MAHIIDMSNARENMAYVGAVPWHGLGSKLTEGAPLEVWCKEAGMGHTIERSRVAFRWGENSGEVGVSDSHNVLWRSDTKEPLAVVSPRYQIVQPGEVLEFFRDLVGAAGDYELETAGLLNGGAKYWALARYAEPLQFGRDVVKPYLLLATACDGSMATTAQHTSVRVVCNNTLQMSLHAERGSAGIVKVRHSTKFDADRVKLDLGVADTIDTYRSDVESLINQTLTRRDSVELLVDVIAKRDSAGEITNDKHVKRVVDEIMISLARAPGANLETAHGTGWGLMNAVTHYVDFKARARSDNNRFNSGQFGAGAKLKQDVYNAIAEAA